MNKTQSKIARMFAAIVMSAAMCAPVFSREKWDAPSDEYKQLMAEAAAHDAAVWKATEPQLEAWAKNGKPYIPWAAKPDDLPQATVPAFPGAEGAGKYSFGGRGGKVYVVTTLEDGGPGSFREACEAVGPRIVVFNVAGVITLKHPLRIVAPYLTIAGQTAPGDGVCIAGQTTLVDTHDVVIRYMRFRRGNTDTHSRDDALGGDPIGNIIVDHCSTSWGMDENLSMYRHMYSPKDGGKDQKLPTVNITIQWTISSEALDPTNHAFGGTWGGRNSSFHHNLFSSNTGRNPSVGMTYDFNFTNNVIFNWRHRSLDGGDKGSLYNVINNYYKPGPATPQGDIRRRIFKPQPTWSKADPVARYGKAYVSGNVVDGYPAISAYNWTGGVQFDGTPDMKMSGSKLSEEQVATLKAKVRVDKPFPYAEVTLQTANDAYVAVLADSGATLPARDSVDVRAVEQTRTGKTAYRDGIITDQKQVGGYPDYNTAKPWADLSADGIPLWWKQKYKLDTRDAAIASKDLMSDGYTVIEKYLNGLDPTKKIDWTKPETNRNTLTLEKLRQ